MSHQQTYCGVIGGSLASECDVRDQGRKRMLSSDQLIRLEPEIEDVAVELAKQETVSLTRRDLLALPILGPILEIADHFFHASNRFPKLSGQSSFLEK